MANTYAKNKYVKITGTFSVSSVNTDPTTITLNVMTPAGVSTAYTYALSQVTKSATGIYYKNVQLTSSGNWTYNWVGTGTVADTSLDYTIYVQDSVFP